MYMVYVHCAFDLKKYFCKLYLYSRVVFLNKYSSRLSKFRILTTLCSKTESYNFFKYANIGYSLTSINFCSPFYLFSGKISVLDRVMFFQKSYERPIKSRRVPKL